MEPHLSTFDLHIVLRTEKKSKNYRCSVLVIRFHSTEISSTALHLLIMVRPVFRGNTKLNYFAPIAKHVCRSSFYKKTAFKQILTEAQCGGATKDTKLLSYMKLQYTLQRCWPSEIDIDTIKLPK